jgi:hypothetical protein
LGCTSETSRSMRTHKDCVTAATLLCARNLLAIRSDQQIVRRCNSPSLSFLAPLATSPLESGLPGDTTPGIFRPWAFSTLRRFAPPVG